MESKEGHAKEETPMLVEEKYDNVRFLSFTHKDFVSLINSCQCFLNVDFVTYVQVEFTSQNLG